MAVIFLVILGDILLSESNNGIFSQVNKLKISFEILLQTNKQKSPQTPHSLAPVTVCPPATGNRGSQGSPGATCRPAYFAGVLSSALQNNRRRHGLLPSPLDRCRTEAQWGEPPCPRSRSSRWSTGHWAQVVWLHFFVSLCDCPPVNRERNKRTNSRWMLTKSMPLLSTCSHDF